MTDERTLLAGTGANVIGLAAGVVAAFGVQLLLGRTLPHGGLALVTVAVQFAFVAAGPGAGPANGAEISLTDFAALISEAAGVEPDAGWSAAPEEEAVAVFSDEEQREVEERLRGLGYLE